ncbi:hypothetical protein BDN67DRAFT_391726 [Paxillus ammoniavirescens]|nr:hypothetical protein BDN67DRAFT_391726 [Paxillus ammoniavirescens]
MLDPGFSSVAPCIDYHPAVIRPQRRVCVLGFLFATPMLTMAAPLPALREINAWLAPVSHQTYVSVQHPKSPFTESDCIVYCLYVTIDWRR